MSGNSANFVNLRASPFRIFSSGLSFQHITRASHRLWQHRQELPRVGVSHDGTASVDVPGALLFPLLFFLIFAATISVAPFPSCGRCPRCACENPLTIPVLPVSFCLCARFLCHLMQAPLAVLLLLACSGEFHPLSSNSSSVSRAPHIPQQLANALHCLCTRRFFQHVGSGGGPYFQHRSA